MAKHSNVWMKILERMLCMRGGQSQGLSDLLVNDNIDAHAALGGGLQHSVQTVLLILRWRSSQI